MRHLLLGTLSTMILATVSLNAATAKNVKECNAEYSENKATLNGNQKKADFIAAPGKECRAHGGIRMARIFVTGSADGLGLMAARMLASDRHSVVLHARSQERADATRRVLPEAETIVIGDVVNITGMRSVVDQANATGRFDAVIHNVGIGYSEPRRIETEDGLSHLFAVNVLAPYLLTALMTRPDRLVYLSSGMHSGGRPQMDDLQWERRPWKGSQAYAETKFLDVLLALGVAQR